MSTTNDSQIAVTDAAEGNRNQITSEVSIVMPCLNEAASVADCVRQALETMEEHGIHGEVIVCDNGSTDDSARLAEDAGAHVFHEDRRGYGSAYLRALSEARGQYIVMADADGTYDFRLIPQFIEPLRMGYDLVMGSRMKDQMSGDSIPFLHRYVGVPTLTGFLNIVAGGSVSDAHCGMRAFTAEGLERMRLSTTGMEFASEMIVKAIRGRLKIAEIPIPYYPRVGESKLRTFRDGWRHLRFLLLESPTFLFIVPGFLMMLSGVVALGVLAPGRVQIGSLSFDFHYMVVAALLTLLGWQVVALGLFAKVFAVTEGICPPDRLIQKFINVFSLEKAMALSGAVTMAGLAFLLWVLVSWIQHGFGFSEGIMLRPALFGMTLLVVGVGSAFSAFFLSALLVDRQTTVVSLSRI